MPPVLALLAACSAGRPADDELVVLIEQPPATIDPRYNVQAADFKISRLVYAPLVSTDTPTADLKMELAASLASRAGAGGGNDWELTLRDARFSDGKAVTTDDVVYTLEVLRDPRTGGAAARLRKGFADAGLVRVEVVDQKRMIFHLAHAHAPFAGDLNFGLMERSGDRDAVPRGAGAFVIERQDGETYYLAPNPYYYGGRPPARRLVVKTIRDANSRLLALVGGSADLTQNTISPLLIDAVAASPRLRVATDRSSTYTYLVLNNDDPILRDVRVRRAIACAIDRDAIIHTKLHDRAVAATGMLPAFHWAYEPDVPRAPYDPALAKRLLDEAGYPDPDGDGPRKRFSIVYKTSSDKLRMQVASVVADMLEKVGIDVDLRVNEFATVFADLKKGNYQMSLMQVTEIAEPDLYIQFFASERIPTRDNLDAGANRARYRNPEVDRLIKDGRRTLDREQRKRIYSQIQKILARDLPVVSLWHEDNIVVTRRNVRGFAMLPTAQLSNLDKTYKAR